MAVDLNFEKVAQCRNWEQIEIPCKTLFIK